MQVLDSLVRILTTLCWGLTFTNVYITMPLCSLCEQVTPWTLKAIRFNNANAADSKLCNPHHQSFLALQESSHKCELCRLLCNALRENKYTPGIQLQRDLPIFLASVIHRNSDHRIEAPQVYNIVVQCGKVFALLYASADPQSEAAISHAVAGRLPLPPESQEHVEMVATWLEECRRHHPACKIDQMGQNSESALQRKTSELPRRVIDTGTSLDSTIRLVESLGSEEYYVASSHRWPTDPAKHYTTTRATIKNRRKSMSLEDMPRVFQDAVTATRKLGFRYLWIDSLCIIQDDPLDWEEQSVLMGHIYYYASITIMSATTPIPSKKFYQEDSPEGFLYRVPELLKLPTVTMDYYDEKWQVKGNWIIQDRPIYLSRNLELLTRGWVLQEELLSRRKIIYAPDQTLWVSLCTYISIICLRIKQSNADQHSTLKSTETSRGPSRDFKTIVVSKTESSATIGSDLSKLTLTESLLSNLIGCLRYLVSQHISACDISKNTTRECSVAA